MKKGGFNRLDVIIIPMSIEKGELREGELPEGMDGYACLITAAKIEETTGTDNVIEENEHSIIFGVKASP